MTDVAELNLGIPQNILVDRVEKALIELGATDPSRAVITEYLAAQMVRMGVHDSARVIGGTLGHSRVINGSMRRFSRYMGGRREPWQDYEWFLPEPQPSVSRFEPFKKLTRRFKGLS